LQSVPATHAASLVPSAAHAQPAASQLARSSCAAHASIAMQMPGGHATFSGHGAIALQTHPDAAPQLVAFVCSWQVSDAAYARTADSVDPPPPPWPPPPQPGASAIVTYTARQMPRLRVATRRTPRR